MINYYAGDEPWENLSIAIVKQLIDDYVAIKIKKAENPEKIELNFKVGQVKADFNSKLIKNICPLPTNKLLEEAEKRFIYEYKKYKLYKVFSIPSKIKLLQKKQKPDADVQKLKNELEAQTNAIINACNDLDNEFEQIYITAKFINKIPRKKLAKTVYGTNVSVETLDKLEVSAIDNIKL